MMSEAAQNQTEATTSSEASGETLLTGSEPAGTTQQQGEPADTLLNAEGTTEAGTNKESTQPAGAPDKYEFTAPEGQTFDAGLIDSFSAAAKDANLPQDAAQKIVEKMAPALAARYEQQAATIRAEWLEQTKADTEFGGEKLMQNMGVAKKALDTFDPLPGGENATTPLRTLLKQSGLGNNPEVLRFFYRAGKAISEDNFVVGREPVARRNIGDILYDNTPQGGK